ncbi:GntR family transcriptional regulator [Ramlibacter sp. AW1]|uniref:GntR family transcriptional regulator n=1 Tax=Ramlibacter aurantiacus TaxID=2801330 RepID=A0A936ZKJ7_9BURK|nr:GntR family transcriptional regulator [Ramlibacter aurantiacus]MBL0421903.1 GntR family transcriptional regulator [Ramlibacter aurantiacus]
MPSHSTDPSTATQAYWQAYGHIRNKILSGEFAGGERINPADIGDELGISRMPAREALRQLDAEGLVTIRPNRGAVVTELTPAEVSELFEMRAVLEALAARLALPHLTADDLVELETLRQRMDRARGDVKLWIQRHNEFHDFIVAHASRPRLAGDIRRMRDALQPHLLLYIDVYKATEMSGFEHETMMDAIRSKNAQLLELCVRDHVMSAGDGVIAFLEQRQAAAAPRRGRARAAVAAEPKQVMAP